MDKNALYKNLFFGALGLAAFAVLIIILIIKFYVPQTLRTASLSAGGQQPATQAIAKISEDDANKIKEEAKSVCDPQLNGAATATPACTLGYDSFYRSKAVFEVNDAICTLINTPEEKIDCLDSVYMTIAMKRLDPSYCAKLSKETQQKACSDQIHYTLASLTPERGRELCSKILSQAVKTKCLDTFAK